ncbi:MAG: HAMP domain-containing sensor histidine kinase [candidate division WOR-3 bacterium]
MSFNRLISGIIGVLIFTILIFFGFYLRQRKVFAEVALEDVRLRSHFISEAVRSSYKDENELKRAVKSIVETTNLDYLVIIQGGKIKVWESKYEGFLPIGDIDSLVDGAYRVIYSPFYPIVEYTQKVDGFWVLCGYSNFHLNSLLKSTVYGMIFLLFLELLVFGSVIIFFYVSEKRLRQAEIDALKEREEARYLREVAALSSQVAHEIRNPLNSLSMIIQLLEKEGLSYEQVELIKKSISRMLEAIDRFRDINRPLKVSKEVLDVESIINEVLQDFEEEMKVNGVRVEKCIKVKNIMSDKTLLKHALSNIIRNSTEAFSNNAQNKVIKIFAHLEGEYASFEIEDNGPGMTPEVLSKAFDYFFTTKSSGTGLGLGLVRRIARALGGDVKIESKFGEGTRVILVVRNG